jgi:tRNA(adenine34) deaminase
LQVKDDEFFMREAYRQAEWAAANEEIPVGAVIVANNQIIAKAGNQVEMLQDPTTHAEMIAMTSAFNYLGSKYLDEAILYVTLEPCAMCAAAMYWAQLKRMVFATQDPKRGYSTYGADLLHPGTEVEYGILKEECKALIDDFFLKLRSK